MEVNSVTAPLANLDTATTARQAASVQGAKAETDRPVQPTFPDPAPRFPYPDTSRGKSVDIEA
ncbi:MAG: hypothetical protein AAF530_08690 [Pseudomonadota bacterium]